jgi:hypothetical protein
MTVYPLPYIEAAKGATHKVVITAADLNDTAGLTKTLTIQKDGGNFPVKSQIECTHIDVVTAFSGGTVATLTLKLGDAGAAERFFTAASKDLLSTGCVAAARSINTQPYALTTAGGILALFTATVGNLNGLTAGQINVYLKIVDLREYDGVPAM